MPPPFKTLAARQPVKSRSNLESIADQNPHHCRDDVDIRCIGIVGLAASSISMNIPLLSLPSVDNTSVIATDLLGYSVAASVLKRS